MQVILLERIPRLGQMGDVVKVKNGFARNFLLPQGKALRANSANKAKFEAQKLELEARNLERKKEAEAINEKLDGNRYIMVRSAGATGQLYGSVSTRDIAIALEENGFRVGRSQIKLRQPIKLIGVHEVTISLHPEVESIILLNVARSEDEAERQAKGEDLTGRAPAATMQEEEDDLDLEDVFDNPEDVELEDDDAQSSVSVEDGGDQKQLG
jgi:large subunit ribosomal protein L9